MVKFIREGLAGLVALARVRIALALLVVATAGLMTFAAGCQQDQKQNVLAYVDNAYRITGKIESSLNACAVEAPNQAACELAKSGLKDVRSSLQDAKNPATASEPIPK